MGEEEFEKFLAGGEYLEDSTIRDILNAQKPIVDFPDRQAMDSTFLNTFEDIAINAGFEAAVDFARSSLMGKCQDRHVIWALPYNVQGVHWVTVFIARAWRFWGVVDSFSQPSYPYLGEIVEALVSSIPVLGEPDKPWEFGYIEAQQQTDGWSCGIHTAENILYFLNGGQFPTERDIDIVECRARYLDAFIVQGHPHALANLETIIAARSTDAVPSDTAPTDTPTDTTPIATAPVDITPTDENSRKTRIKRKLMAAKSKLSTIAKTGSPSSSTPTGASCILDSSPTTVDFAWAALDPNLFRAMGLDWTPWEEVPQPQASQPASPTTQDSDGTEGMEWTPAEQESEGQLEAPRTVDFNWASSPPQATNVPVDIPIEIHPSPTPQPPTCQPFEWVEQPQPQTNTRFIEPIAFNRTPPQSGLPHLQIPQSIPFNDFGFGISRGRSTHEFKFTGSNVRPFSDSPSRRRHQPPYQAPW